MSNALAVPPRIVAVPTHSAGVLVDNGGPIVDLYRQSTSNELMPWQQDVLRSSMVLVDDVWSARTVAIVKPRQQGATEAALLRMLVGLVDGEHQLYTAGLYDVARSSFERFIDLIEGVPELAARIDRIRRAHGNESIRLKNGAWAVFRTRGRSTSARSVTADLIVADDAEMLRDTQYANLVMAQTSRPNPQMWFIGTPPADEPTQAWKLGVPRPRVLSQVRDRAIRGVDPRLLYVEYSADDARHEDGTLKVDTTLDSVAAAANPATGHLINPSRFAEERRMMPAKYYESNRLGIGIWPPLDEEPS